MEQKAIRVTVWNEFIHEKIDPEVTKIYPQGIHSVIAGFLGQEGMRVRTATLDMPEHGLTAEVLAETDVLIWWAHMAHDQVSDEVVARVYDRVQQGMGLILLHSAHASKLFAKLCGTDTHKLRWRESGDKEILWLIEPGHPIAEGLEETIVLEREETYGERFEIPAPDELVFLGWFSGGEVFRSGCCYHRGRGRVFYFQPGHETLPTYYHPGIQRVICNAVRWAAPVKGPAPIYDRVEPILSI